MNLEHAQRVLDHMQKQREKLVREFEAKVAGVS